MKLKINGLPANFNGVKKGTLKIGENIFTWDNDDLGEGNYKIEKLDARHYGFHVVEDDPDDDYIQYNAPGRKFYRAYDSVEFDWDFDVYSPTISMAKITFSGYKKFKIFINSANPGFIGYMACSKLDTSFSSWEYPFHNQPQVYASTFDYIRIRPEATHGIGPGASTEWYKDSWLEVVYDNPDQGEHFFYIVSADPEAIFTISNIGLTEDTVEGEWYYYRQDVPEYYVFDGDDEMWQDKFDGSHQAEFFVSTNQDVDNSCSVGKIIFKGLDKMVIYFGQNSEPDFDYLCTSYIDSDLPITSTSSGNPHVIENECEHIFMGKEMTLSGDWTQNLEPIAYFPTIDEEHHLYIIYKKDSSTSEGDDIGIFTIQRDFI